MSLAHALLVSLIHEPKSGYDLAKQFDGSVGFFWQATHQQIYRELTKLEQQDLITAKAIAQESRPDKKVFSVTDLGLADLKAWLLRASETAPVKDEFLVKIYAGHLLPHEAMLKKIQEHRQLHQQQLATYQEIERKFFGNFRQFQQPTESPPPEPPKLLFPYLTLRRGISFEQSWLDWCDEAIALLQNKIMGS